MEEYLRRRGLEQNRRVYVFKGGEKYIKRALDESGWVENTNPGSTAFHLKWTSTDTEADYRALKSGQRFNHFAGNRDLTTKSGLLKKFRGVSEYGVGIDRFFPRSYDLGDST
jgi:hypothetical protein